MTLSTKGQEFTREGIGEEQVERVNITFEMGNKR